MALLLIIDVDRNHSDSVEDRRGCYKRGDIVQVLDDSNHNGDLVANPIQPPWYLIKINGVTADQVRHAMEPERLAVDPTGDTVLMRRKFRLNVADIPAGARARLLADRYIEVSLTQARNYIRNKITNESL